MQTITDKSGAVTISLDDALALVTEAAKTESAYEAAIATFKAAPVSYEYYKKLRGAFIAAKRETSPICTIDAANKAWERLCQRCGYKAPKSTTPAAQKKAAQRAAKKGQNDKNVKVSPETPKKGAEKAAQIEMKLSALEANIIKWLRSGQWAMVESAIAAQRDMTAPV